MTDAGSSSLRFEVSGEVSPLIAELAEHRVASLTSRQPSLEEIFLDHYDSSDGKVGGSVLLRRAFRDARTRTLAFAYLFAGVSYIQPVSDHPRIPRWLPGSPSPTASPTTRPWCSSTATRTTC
ncbi:MAG TPA: hypothetical protein VGI50_01055 [Solirubrobacteraceae bacterium]